MVELMIMRSKAAAAQGAVSAPAADIIAVVDEALAWRKVYAAQAKLAKAQSTKGLGSEEARIASKELSQAFHALEAAGAR